MKTVASPCIDLCRLDIEGELCVGCGRTVGEIKIWMPMSDEDKLACIQRGRDRLASMGRPLPPYPPPPTVPPARTASRSRN